MSRIGIGISGIERQLLSSRAAAEAAVSLATLRKSTGEMINSPADNPSAFVTLSGFQSRLSKVRDVMSNVTSATSLVSQSQSLLEQVTDQLDVIRTELLNDEDHSLTPEERTEAQAKIDAAIEEINSLVGTSVDGRPVLDGSADFTVSGRDSTQVARLTVHSRGNETAPTISGQVTTAATRAALDYAGKSGQSSVQADATFTLTGTLGSREFTVTEDQALSTVVDEVNQYSHETGVTASLDGDDLTFTSVAYGSDADIEIEASSGTFTTTGGNDDGTANGTDAVVQINGQTYDGSTDSSGEVNPPGRISGNTFTYSENGFRFTMELEPGYTGTLDTMTVTGDALTFRLSTEAGVDSTVAIPGLQPGKLGGVSGSLDELLSGGALAGLDTNTSHAIRVVDEALGQLAQVEGSVDGFYNSQISTASSLMTDLEDELTDAIDSINEVNDEEQDLIITYNSALADNALSGLAILQQQRLSVVSLIQQIAGLD